VLERPPASLRLPIINGILYQGKTSKAMTFRVGTIGHVFPVFPHSGALVDR